MNADEIRAAVGKLNPTDEGRLIDAVAVLAQFTAEVAAQLAELNANLTYAVNEGGVTIRTQSTQYGPIPLHVQVQVQP